MKRGKVYIRLIITYSIFFAIPLILNLIMLESAKQNEKEKINESIYSELENAMTYLENEFLVLDMFVENFSENNTIRKVSQWKESGKKYNNISKLKTIHEDMKILDASTFAEECYLYFSDSSLAISSKQIFVEMDSLRRLYQYGGMSWEQWMYMLEEKYGMEFFPEALTQNGSDMEDCILYVKPLVNEKGINGTIHIYYVFWWWNDSYIYCGQ